MIAGSDVLARELLARVDDVALERAEAQGLVFDHRVVLAGLAEVDGQADDLGGVLVLDPLQHHARVEAAGVEQQHAVDLGRIGLVGGGAGREGVLVIGLTHRAAQATGAHVDRSGAKVGCHPEGKASCTP